LKNKILKNKNTSSLKDKKEHILVIEPRDLLNKYMLSFGSSDIFPFLTSCGIANAEDIQSFHNENVEVIIRSLETKKLNILIKFESKEAHKKEINLLAIEFETQYRLSNESKYFYYITNLINKYKTKECDCIFILP
jgi:hypothetical protein